MQSVVRTATVVGVDAVPVEVQADVGAGLPSFSIVGLGDLAVMEARDRVRAAIRSCGFEFPNARIVVNLAPAPLRKRGTGFDLPIAAALLTATGQVPRSAVDGASVVGELGLDGAVAPVAGLLAHAVEARRAGLAIAGPVDGLAEAAALRGLRLRPVAHLNTLRRAPDEFEASASGAAAAAIADPDLADVAGHAEARRALEIAAAGGHNLLMSGIPGSGKTLLARCLPGILPPLDDAERLETALVHSVAGLDPAAVLGGVRPFRAPHHSSSIAGLVGGGSPPRPGEVSLAHNGVLFLDELAEFGPAALQTLRQPLEDASVTLVRAEGSLRYPARVTLVAATNPCPCGHLGDAERACTCPPDRVARYRGRVGGPLLDRIDLRIGVGRVDPERLVGAACAAEPSAAVRDRVLAARAFAACAGRAPAGRLEGATLVTACMLTDDARSALTASARASRLSGRGVVRVLRVARTIADLDGSARVGAVHVLEAIHYRGEDDHGW
jgi:magnesium chelatase family protein